MPHSSSGWGRLSYIQLVVSSILTCGTGPEDFGYLVYPTINNPDIYYNALQRKLEMLTFNWLDDEACEIKYDGYDIVTITHDEHGWDGMVAVIVALSTLAKRLGVEIKVEGEPGV